MENTADTAQIKPSNLNCNVYKRKCLTNSEYNAMVNQIDSWIIDPDFVLNKYGKLINRALSEFSQLYEHTVLSIVDSRIQYYVRQRHHKVFNTSNNNSPAHNSKTTPNSTKTSPNHQKLHNKRTNTLYNRYKELVAGGNTSSPLITLADKLRMPAMLVAKNVLEDHINEERLKDQMEEHFRNYDLHTDNNVTSLQQDIYVTSSLDTELDTTANVDVQLSQSLNWLSNKLISMRKVLPPVDLLDESNNSSTYSHSYFKPKTTRYATPHQLATSTWLIRTDPLLAYQVFKCSVIDCYYGSCVEFIKSCTGRRYEQLLEENINFITMGTKANSINGTTAYTTEKECRLRGLDMTPDMVLHEPIAISLSDTNDEIKDNDEHTATNYVGKNDKEIRVLNWIESKAMFGGPDQLRTYMPRQLFPYWNRYGPGAVIFWFGHILEDGQEDKVVHRGVSIDKTTIETSPMRSVHNKTIYEGSSAFSFWSKYCLLMDGFPESSRILQYNNNNNRFNLTKKKNFTTF